MTHDYRLQLQRLVVFHSQQKVNLSRSRSTMSETVLTCGVDIWYNFPLSPRRPSSTKGLEPEAVYVYSVCLLQQYHVSLCMHYVLFPSSLQCLRSFLKKRSSSQLSHQIQTQIQALLHLHLVKPTSNGEHRVLKVVSRSSAKIEHKTSTCDGRSRSCLSKMFTRYIDSWAPNGSDR